MNLDDPPRASARLEYASPDESAKPLLSAGQRRLILYSARLCIGVILYANIGGRIAQWAMGSRVLYLPATGTDAFDRWLIDYPLLVLTAGLLLASLVCVALMLARRWRPPWIVFLPCALIAWILTYVLCTFSIWEEISP